jgi:hypothetical protein
VVRKAPISAWSHYLQCSYAAVTPTSKSDGHAGVQDANVQTDRGSRIGRKIRHGHGHGHEGVAGHVTIHLLSIFVRSYGRMVVRCISPIPIDGLLCTCTCTCMTLALAHTRRARTCLIRLPSLLTSRHFPSLALTSRMPTPTPHDTPQYERFAARRCLTHAPR